jgi:WD40 repeat protein
MSIQCAAFSSDGKRAVSGGGDFTDLSFWDRLRKKSELDWFLCFWDLSTGKQIRHAKGTENLIRSVAYSPVDEKVLSGGDEGDILLWDLEKMQVLKSFVCQSSGIRRNCLVWSQDGKTFLSGSWDGSIRLWSVKSGKELAKLSPSFSPDGKTALFGVVFGTVIWWDLNEWRQIAMNRLHEDELTFVAFSADGKSSISAGWDTDAHTENVKVKFWKLP